MKNKKSFDKLCKFENNAMKYSLYNRDFYHNFRDPHQRSSIALLETPDGRTLTDTNEINEHILEHFTQKFRAPPIHPPVSQHGSGTSDPDPQLNLDSNPQPKSNPDLDLDLDPNLVHNLDLLCSKFGISLPTLSEETSHLLSDDLNLADFSNAIKMLNPLSAPGPDELPAKLIQQLFSLIPNFLTKVLSKELRETLHGKPKTSPLWSRKIILINKRTKTNTIKQSRPITLLTTFYKVISNALATRLNYACSSDKIIPDSIIAYREGNDPADSIRKISDFIDTSLESKTQAWVIQADIQSAYDKAHRNLLYALLAKLNFPTTFISLIKTILENNQADLYNGKTCLGTLNLELGWVRETSSVVGPLTCSC